MSNEISDLKEAEQMQDAPSPSAPSRSQNNNWVAGVALIVIGGVFLLSNLTDFYLNNWWALFIMIPAFSNFSNAWRSYQKHGRMNRRARGSLTGGMILSLITLAFLFDLDWGLIWPLFLIIGGLSALLGGWFE